MLWLAVHWVISSIITFFLSRIESLSHKYLFVFLTGVQAVQSCSPAVQPSSSLSGCPCQTLSETTANLEGGESDLQTSPSVRVICRLVPVWLEAVPCSVSAVLLLLQFPSSGPSLPSAHCELSHICIMSWPTWPCLACLHLIYSIFDKIFTICIIQEYHSLNIKDTLHQNRS